uniref:Secreted protein n=1 Tax=Ascaris lumbricoides TaxID=6252 RepID=A0A0M3IMB6_ASCLU
MIPATCSIAILHTSHHQAYLTMIIENTPGSGCYQVLSLTYPSALQSQEYYNMRNDQPRRELQDHTKFVYPCLYYADVSVYSTHK